MSPLVVMFAWALWHDLSVYRAAELLPLAGPMYQVTSHATKAECEAEQHAAMTKEELPRAGPRTERLLDGIKVWDPDRQHYTTFRYLCWPVGAGPAPFR
jgi:hypothetical protein